MGRTGDNFVYYPQSGYTSTLQCTSTLKCIENPHLRMSLINIFLERFKGEKIYWDF